MLPRGLRNRTFEHMSNRTMRPQFSAVTKREATGLALEVLEQSERDFFINGTITCHAVCPELMAGMWSGGREAALVDDRLPAWLKKAMGAELVESAHLELSPGQSLDLLPAAPVPPDLHWATPNARVSDALARWISVVDRAAGDVLSPRLLPLLQARIDAWRGGEVPLSRSWVEKEVPQAIEDDGTGSLGAAPEGRGQRGTMLAYTAVIGPARAGAVPRDGRCGTPVLAV